MMPTSQSSLRTPALDVHVAAIKTAEMVITAALFWVCPGEEPPRVAATGTSAAARLQRRWATEPMRKFAAQEPHSAGLKGRERRRAHQQLEVTDRDAIAAAHHGLA